MKIEFLGSGGAITTPKPGCQCQICVEARQKGVPYSRSGPSLFVHGPNILFDTPEEIKAQLNRADIQTIAGCFYSHWHPDHVMGMRVWEMNMDVKNWPPQPQATNIYLPQQVALDFRERLGIWEHLTYLKKMKMVQLIELTDGDTTTLNEIDIYPFRLEEDYVYAFLLSAEDKRVLIVLDEMVGWEPSPDIQGVDLAILPMGLTEFDPLNGQRLIPIDHPVLKSEATFRQTLEVIHQLNASQVILTHIEEVVGLSYNDLKILGINLQQEGLNVTFAYDTLMVEV